MKKVVVIGGGTGTFVTLSALNKIPGLDLTAIVTVADSGGSTGRLRDEFGFLPVGDLRQALAAMAGNDKNWIRNLLLYRFSKGNGLKGHNLGNLILTALQDMTGSTASAIEITSQIFRLQGHIYPITQNNIQLVIEYQDGTIEIGEKVLDDETQHLGDRIINIKTSPRAKIYHKAKTAIEKADVILLGPGDLYGSILPNLIVEGTSQAISHSQAKIILIMNLMTRYTQTHGLTASDHKKIIEKYLKKPVDIVLVNKGKIAKRLLDEYKKQHEFPVIDDLKEVVRADLVKETMFKPQDGDQVKRSYLRHDSIKLGKILRKIIYE